MSRPLVIAHRGASAVEYQNSLAAFRAAARLGADAVELDVHATTDGVLFVHHDRVAGGRDIPSATAAELAGVRLPNGEPLPTLAQALDAAGRLRVFVEVKTLPPAWDDALLRCLDAGPNPAGYAVHGFDHRIVARLHARRPTLPCGVLTASYQLDNTTPARAAGASALWPEASLVDATFVAAAHGAGLAVYPWTPDTEAELVRLRDLGVDGLCTNHPDLARAVVGGRA